MLVSPVVKMFLGVHVTTASRVCCVDLCRHGHRVYVFMFRFGMRVTRKNEVMGIKRMQLCGYISRQNASYANWESSHGMIDELQSARILTPHKPGMVSVFARYVLACSDDTKSVYVCFRRQAIFESNDWKRVSSLVQSCSQGWMMAPFEWSGDQL